MIVVYELFGGKTTTINCVSSEKSCGTAFQFERHDTVYIKNRVYGMKCKRCGEFMELGQYYMDDVLSAQDWEDR